MPVVCFSDAVNCMCVQQLTDSCSDHVEHVIQESSLDYVQDVQLARSCKEEVSHNHTEQLAYFSIVSWLFESCNMAHMNINCKDRHLYI